MGGGHKLHMDPLELNSRISRDITEIVLDDDDIEIPKMRELVLKNDHVFQEVQTLKNELFTSDSSVLKTETEFMPNSLEIGELEGIEQLAGMYIELGLDEVRMR